jgi:hypothetical protein
MKGREKRTKMKWNKSENEKDMSKKKIIIMRLIFRAVKTFPDLTESS